MDYNVFFIKLDTLIDSGIILQSKFKKSELFLLEPYLQSSIAIKSTLDNRRNKVIEIVDFDLFHRMYDDLKLKAPVYKECFGIRSRNILINGSSKKGKSTIDRKPLLVRGFNGLNLKYKESILDISLNTEFFGVSSFVINEDMELLSEKRNPMVILVENLESFFYIEKNAKSTDLAIWYSGNITNDIYDLLTSEGFRKSELFVFPDYDKIGIRNYLRIKKHLLKKDINISIFIPDNIESLFEKYGNRNLLIKQNYSKDVVFFAEQANLYHDKNLKIILDLIAKYGGGLEQESTLINC